MPTPSKTGWNRLDMQLWELCTSSDRTQPRTESRDLQAETEAKWEAWVAERIDRAERNRLARHAVRSERNVKLHDAVIESADYPDAFNDIEPYGAEADDYDWVANPFEDDKGVATDLPPAGSRTFYQQWIAERVARANRNRDDGKKPTASRASDEALDHHEMDYDIFMDSLIQQTDTGYVRSYLASDDSRGMSQWSGRHDDWYNPEPTVEAADGTARATVMGDRRMG